MGFARRARGLAKEINDLRADSVEEGVNGTLKRVEGLKEDMVSIKALQGVKVSRACICSSINGRPILEV